MDRSSCMHVLRASVERETYQVAEEIADHKSSRAVVDLKWRRTDSKVDLKITRVWRVLDRRTAPGKLGPRGWCTDGAL